MEWYIYLAFMVIVSMGLIIIYIVLKKNKIVGDIPIVSGIIDPILYQQRKVIMEVPVKTNDPTVSGAASYNTKTGMTSVIAVDEDDDKITTVAQSFSIKGKKVLIEEQPTSLGIHVESKKHKKTGKKVADTVIADSPIYK